MKMTFRGWSREVYAHPKQVTPVNHGRWINTNGHNPGDALKWTSATTAYGKVTSLGLSGDFLVKFEFTPEDFTGALGHFAESEPEAALLLFSQLQAKAMIALTKQSAAEASKTG